MFILLWLVFGIVGAMIGDKKGKGGLGFLLGVLLGPFGVLIIFLIKGNQKTCPYCRGTIHPDAIRCPHCQKDLPSQTKTGMELAKTSFQFTHQRIFWTIVTCVCLVFVLYLFWWYSV
jgi:hypothetical protein